MCYAGGPRCQPEADKRLWTTSQTYQAALASQDDKAIEKALKAYNLAKTEHNLTPMGIAALRDAGKHMEADIMKAKLEALTAQRKAEGKRQSHKGISPFRVKPELVASMSELEEAENPDTDLRRLAEIAFLDDSDGDLLRVKAKQDAYEALTQAFLDSERDIEDRKFAFDHLEEGDQRWNLPDFLDSYNPSPELALHVANRLKWGSQFDDSLDDSEEMEELSALAREHMRTLGLTEEADLPNDWLAELLGTA